MATFRFPDRSIGIIERSQNEFGPFMDGRSVFEETGQIIGTNIWAYRVVINGNRPPWQVVVKHGSPAWEALTNAGYRPAD